MPSSLAAAVVRRVSFALLLLWLGMIGPAVAEAPTCLVPIGADLATGVVLTFHEASDGALLIGAERGVFRRDGADLVAVGADQEAGAVRAFHEASDGALLVGAGNGVFRRDADTLVAIGADQETGWVQAFHEASDGALLVGAENGVFRGDGDHLVAIGADQETGPIRAFHEASFHEASDGALLIGADHGVFRRDGDTLVVTGAVQETGRVQAFHEASDGALLVGAENGVFRLHRQHSWTDAEVVSLIPPNVGRAADTVLYWTVTHPCAPVLTPNDISFGSEVPEDWIKRTEVVDDGQTNTRTIQATISFGGERGGTYQAQPFVHQDGRDVPLGEAVSVRVDWAVAHYLEHYATWIGMILGIGHTALFILLILGARWSAFCWRVLTDPVWGKTGLWFYFALRNAGPLQRWVMARWFDTVRQKTSRQAYLPMTLSDDGEPVGRSTELLDADPKWERLWVQGNAGMGKTAMISDLQSRFFADPDLPTLRQAYARFRSVPIIVPLREYRHVALDSSHPENWVPSVARMAVSAFGVAFENDALFRAMVKSGGFLLVLDGANEVERDKEIELFALSAPAARLLVTSQMPGGKSFTNWRLPGTIHDDIEPLLCLFLGQATGEQVFARIKPTPLFDAILSGYDVRLIADLVEDRGPDLELPTDRPGLYQLILDTIRMPGGALFPEDILCKAAWAMWRDGERKLEADNHLDKDLLEPLIREGQKLLRIVDGQRFEFRHDQMRAYLAARWAARHETHPVSLFESQGDIWRLSRKEQQEVWTFFADMCVAEQPEEATSMWKWSTTHPDRGILQHALQHVLTQSGYDPGMLSASAAMPEESKRPLVGRSGKEIAVP
jgi:hypothetical protein